MTKYTGLKPVGFEAERGYIRPRQQLRILAAAETHFRRCDGRDPNFSAVLNESNFTVSLVGGGKWRLLVPQQVQGRKGDVCTAGL